MCYAITSGRGSASQCLPRQPVVRMRLRELAPRAKTRLVPGPADEPGGITVRGLARHLTTG